MKPESFKTLYICYFGLNEPLVQTQVIPYLREIQEDGIQISLLTFEQNPKQHWTKEKIDIERQRLSDQGINWHFLTYHKRPSLPATIFDIICGAWFTWKIIRRDRIDVLHARVHVPALMGAIAKQLTFGRRPKLLFDIRGFFPEEYTDAGVWKENGLLFRFVKRVERWLFGISDGFVVLTEKAREILFPESKDTGYDRSNRPVEVIPCCVDIDWFNREHGSLPEQSIPVVGFKDRFVVTYLGSFGGWYLTEEMMDFFETSREINPKTFALVLTQRNKEEIIGKFRERGFGEDDFFVTSVAPEQVAGHLKTADLAISFIKSCYSKQSSSPTKIAEYLACGLPIVANRGVGDIDGLIEDDGVGVIVDGFSREDYIKALSAVEELRGNTDFGQICRKSAEKRFDLRQVGGVRYRRLYAKLLDG